MANTYNGQNDLLEAPIAHAIAPLFNETLEDLIDDCPPPPPQIF